MGFLGKKADNCQGSTWFAELQHWTSLSYVTSDAGKGLQAGIARVQQHRRATNQVPLEKGLDVFHTKQEAQRVLSTFGTGGAAVGAGRGGQPSRRKARRQGLDARGLTTAARVAWDKASMCFQPVRAGGSGLETGRAGLEVFRPDGQLNDRAWAEEQVAWALPRFAGSEWSKVRRFLQEQGVIHIPGSVARPVGSTVAARSVAGRLGAAMVAAAATAAEIGRDGSRRLWPRGLVGAAGPLPKVGPAMAGIVPSGRGGVAANGASQQRGGVHE